MCNTGAPCFSKCSADLCEFAAGRGRKVALPGVSLPGPGIVALCSRAAEGPEAGKAGTLMSEPRTELPLWGPTWRMTFWVS